MSLRDPIVVLEDMLEAVQSIEEYSTNLSFDVYDADKKTKDAVVRNFEILGEAATHITDEVRVRFPDIPWNRVIGLRNIIIHRYFGVDHAMVWFIIKEQLPSLKTHIEAALHELSPDS